MIAAVLAAGFGTRCRPLTNNKPKSLLPLVNDTVIDEQLRWLFACKRITKVVVVSNQKFYDSFIRWREGSVWRDSVEIINDGVTHENNRRGAIGDLAFALERCTNDSDVLILGSDNLFEDSLEKIIHDFDRHHRKVATVAIHDFKSSFATVQPNEVVLNNAGIITHYTEKPKQPATSDFVSLLYILPQKYFPQVAEYLAEGNNPDSAGSFIEWLVKNKYEVRGLRMSGCRFDIGDVAAYHATQKHYSFVVN